MMHSELGMFLREHRASRGISLREAQRLTGVDRDSISAIERGESQPYAPTLAKLAKGYNIPLRELLELEESSPLAEAPRGSGPYRSYRLEVKPGDPSFGVSREALAEYGISVTGPELNALNVYLESLTQNEGEVGLIVSVAGDRVDDERITRLGQFVLGAGLLEGKVHAAVTEGIRRQLAS